MLGRFHPTVVWRSAFGHVGSWAASASRWLIVQLVLSCEAREEVVVMSGATAGVPVQPTIAGLDDEGRLTSVAKWAIIRYMWLIVALPAGLVAFLSGVGGFFISKVYFESGFIAGQIAGQAEGNKAAVAAISDIAQKIGEARQEIGEARQDAKRALDDANRADAVANTAAQDATKQANDAHAVSQRANALLTSDTNSLAAALAQTETFRQAATTIIVPALGDQNNKIAALEMKLEARPRVELMDVVLKPNDCSYPNDSAAECPLPPPARGGQILAVLIAGGPIHGYTLPHIQKYGEDGGTATFVQVGGKIVGNIPSKIRLVLIRNNLP